MNAAAMPPQHHPQMPMGQPPLPQMGHNDPRGMFTAPPLGAWSAGDGLPPMVSNTNLYVEGVPNEWVDKDLRQHFQQYGDTTAARILIDKATNQSRGVGFVHFGSHEQALAALTAADGQKPYQGALRNFKIKFANRARKEKKAPPPPPPRGGPRYEEPCRYYARGHCKRGNSCFYRHVPRAQNDYPPPNPAPRGQSYPMHPRYPPAGSYSDYSQSQNHYVPQQTQPDYSQFGGQYPAASATTNPYTQQGRGSGAATRWQPYDMSAASANSGVAATSSSSARPGQTGASSYDYTQQQSYDAFANAQAQQLVVPSAANMGQMSSRTGDWSAYTQQTAAAAAATASAGVAVWQRPS